MESVVNPVLNYKLLKSVCVSLRTCIKRHRFVFISYTTPLSLKPQNYSSIQRQPPAPLEKNILARDKILCCEVLCFISYNPYAVFVPEKQTSLQYQKITAFLWNHNMLLNKTIIWTIKLRKKKYFELAPCSADEVWFVTPDNEIN